ncbi:MAG: hypothetical protein AAGG44_02860 [Planctomycetota bacterium]
MSEPYWLLIVPVLVAMTAILFRDRRKQQEIFRERWPPISDDEFVARCTPGTRRETALRVRKIVSEQLGIPYESVYPEQHFADDLDCD